jgi:conjugal transfer/entry exclusion protein
VLLVSTGDPKPLSAVADRAWDTLLGGTIALIGYAVWPTREAATLRTTVSRLLTALADYAEGVFDGYVAGGLDAQLRTRLGERARTARRARADAQASLDRANAEPPRMRVDTALAQSVLGGARRIVIVLHALRTTLQDSTETVPVPEVGVIGHAVVDALRQLANAVLSLQAATLPDLRALQQQLEAIADATEEERRSRRIAVVAAHLDPLVDAVDTVAHMLDPVEALEEAST